METGVRIFLAEDNEGDVFLVRWALRRQGLKCQLQVARNGEEAMDLLEKAEHGPHEDAPELILLDLNLPRVEGAQVLSRIRSSEAFAKTPVIVLTSSDSPADRKAALALGANAYFRKPTELSSFMQLGQAIEEAIAGFCRA